MAALRFDAMAASIDLPRLLPAAFSLSAHGLHMLPTALPLTVQSLLPSAATKSSPLPPGTVPILTAT